MKSNKFFNSKFKFKNKHKVLRNATHTSVLKNVTIMNEINLC